MNYLFSSFFLSDFSSGVRLDIILPSQRWTGVEQWASINHQPMADHKKFNKPLYWWRWLWKPLVFCADCNFLTKWWLVANRHDPHHHSLKAGWLFWERRDWFIFSASASSINAPTHGSWWHGGQTLHNRLILLSLELQLYLIGFKFCHQDNQSAPLAFVANLVKPDVFCFLKLCSVLFSALEEILLLVLSVSELCRPSHFLERHLAEHQMFLDYLLHFYI